MFSKELLKHHDSKKIKSKVNESIAEAKAKAYVKEPNKTEVKVPEDAISVVNEANRNKKQKR